MKATESDIVRIHSNKPEYSPTDINKIELKKLAKLTEYSGDWTENSADLLESWLEKCISKSELYTQAAKNSRKWHRILQVPAILLSAVSTALSYYLTGSGCDSSTDISTLQVVSSCFVSATAITVGLNELYQFSKTQQKHINAAGGFLILSKQIQMQLHLPIGRKGDIEVVLTSIHDQHTNIINSAPLI